VKILITAGPTREALDPVRFLSNRSTGKMGYALAEAAIEAGHTVSLVSGPVVITAPEGLAEFVPVISAADMAEAVKKRFPDMDAAIMCAAVADYRPAEFSPLKLKKKDDDLILRLERTEDILKSLGAMKKSNQILAGFAAETDHLKENALAKLEKKNLDWIAANDVSASDRGFASSSNAVTLFGRNGAVHQLDYAPKKEIAEEIIRIILD